MTDRELKQKTIDTYNKSALELAAYFSGIGARTDDIDTAFELVGSPKNARVVEIGCGDGRDAKDIVNKCEYYIGFDISVAMTEIAQQNVPSAEFVVADAVTFNFPNDLDIVFAFASLLHLDKGELKVVLDRVYDALRPDGVIFLSLKYRSAYESEIKKDQFGERLFFFYNEETITTLAGDRFKLAYSYKDKRRNTEWMQVALKKQTYK